MRNRNILVSRGLIIVLCGLFWACETDSFAQGPTTIENQVGTPLVYDHLTSSADCQSKTASQIEQEALQAQKAVQKAAADARKAEELAKKKAKEAEEAREAAEKKAKAEAKRAKELAAKKAKEAEEAREAAEKKAKAEAKRAKELAEQKAKDAEELAKKKAKEAEEARDAAEKRAKVEAKRAKELAEKKAKEEEEAREAAEKKSKAEAKRAKELAEERAKAEKEAREAAEKRAKEFAKKKAQEEEEAREAAEKRAKAEAKKAKELAKKKAKEAEEAREMAEKKAKADAKKAEELAKKKAEAEEEARELAEKKAKAEAKKAEELAKKKAKEAEEAREMAEKKAKADAKKAEELAKKKAKEAEEAREMAEKKAKADAKKAEELAKMKAEAEEEARELAKEKEKAEAKKAKELAKKKAKEAEEAREMAEKKAKADAKKAKELAKKKAETEEEARELADKKAKAEAKRVKELAEKKAKAEEDAREAAKKKAKADAKKAEDAAMAARKAEVETIILGSAPDHQVSDLPQKLNKNVYIKRVLASNPDVKAAEMDYRIARLQTLREQGEWQPYFELIGESENNKRENTIEQQLTQLNQTFEEENMVFSANITGSLRGGGEYRLGYSLNDLANNLFDPEESADLDAFDSEFVTFGGLNVTQPLLKNRGRDVAESDLRVSGIREDVAFHKVRRQRMAAIARAEAAYLAAYMAQEAVGLRERSLEISESLLKDVQERKKVGKATSLDVEAAEAGVKVRQIRLLESRGGKFEALQALLDLAQKPMDRREYTLKEPPLPPKPDLKALRKKHTKVASDHPDSIIRDKELDIAKIRLDLSENQKLPELNLVGSFGYNGLGETASESMSRMESGEFDSWSLGLIFRVPLGAGKEERSQYAQALLNYEKAEMGGHDIRMQLENSLKTSVERLVIYYDYYEAQKKIVDIQKAKLADQRKLAEAGKVTSADVLEVEEELTETETRLLDVLIRYNRAAIQLEVNSGHLLKLRNAEFSK